jgi:hypothetical protein
MQCTKENPIKVFILGSCYRLLISYSFGVTLRHWHNSRLYSPNDTISCEDLFFFFSFLLPFFFLKKKKRIITLSCQLVIDQYNTKTTIRCHIWHIDIYKRTTSKLDYLQLWHQWPTCIALVNVSGSYCLTTLDSRQINSWHWSSKKLMFDNVR